MRINDNLSVRFHTSVLRLGTVSDLAHRVKHALTGQAPVPQWPPTWHLTRLFEVVDRQEANRRLVNAVAIGTLEEVRHWLKRADPNQAVDARGAPLEMAAYNGRHDVVQLLLSDPRTDPNRPHPIDGSTALHQAIRRNHVQVARALLIPRAEGPAVEQQPNVYGDTPLILALKAGQREMTALLLSQPTTTIDHVGADGWSALTLAACNGDAQTILELRRQGADLDQPNGRGETAAWLAAVLGHAGVLKALTEPLQAADGTPVRIADVNRARPLDGLTPVMAAATTNHIEALDVLVAIPGVDIDRIAYGTPEPTDKEGRTALTMAAYIGLARVVTSLRGGGATVDQPDDAGLTALHHAAGRGHVGVIHALQRPLEAADGAPCPPADPNLRTAQEGHTPLTLAIALRKPEAIDALVLYPGVDLELSMSPPEHPAGETDWTPLTLAADSRQLNVVRLLRQHGANPDRPNGQGASALWTAAALGRLEVIRAMLEPVNGPGVEKRRTADPNARDRRHGVTPMVAAIYADRVESVEELLRHHRTDAFATSRAGFEPLDHAVLYRAPKCTALLLSVMPAKRRQQELLSLASRAPEMRGEVFASTPALLADAAAAFATAFAAAANAAYAAAAAAIRAYAGHPDRDTHVNAAVNAAVSAASNPVAELMVHLPPVVVASIVYAGSPDLTRCVVDALKNQGSTEVMAKLVRMAVHEDNHAEHLPVELCNAWAESRPNDVAAMLKVAPQKAIVSAFADVPSDSKGVDAVLDICRHADEGAAVMALSRLMRLSPGLQSDFKEALGKVLARSEWRAAAVLSQLISDEELPAVVQPVHRPGYPLAKDGLQPVPLIELLFDVPFYEGIPQRNRDDEVADRTARSTLIAQVGSSVLEQALDKRNADMFWAQKPDQLALSLATVLVAAMAQPKVGLEDNHIGGLMSLKGVAPEHRAGVASAVVLLVDGLSPRPIDGAGVGNYAASRPVAPSTEVPSTEEPRTTAPKTAWTPVKQWLEGLDGLAAMPIVQADPIEPSDTASTGPERL